MVRLFEQSELQPTMVASIPLPANGIPLRREKRNWHTIDVPPKAKVKEIPVPKEPLKLGRHEPLFGVQEVITDTGFCYKAKSLEEAKFIVYSQKPNEYIVKVPQDNIILGKAIGPYERYLKELRDKLHKSFINRVLDHKLADSLTQTVFAEFNLPEVAG